MKERCNNCKHIMRHPSGKAIHGYSGERVWCWEKQTWVDNDAMCGCFEHKDNCHTFGYTSPTNG